MSLFKHELMTLFMFLQLKYIFFWIIFSLLYSILGGVKIEAFKIAAAGWAMKGQKS